MESIWKLSSWSHWHYTIYKCQWKWKTKHFSSGIGCTTSSVQAAMEALCKRERASQIKPQSSATAAEPPPRLGVRSPRPYPATMLFLPLPLVDGQVGSQCVGQGGHQHAGEGHQGHHLAPVEVVLGFQLLSHAAHEGSHLARLQQDYSLIRCPLKWMPMAVAPSSPLSVCHWRVCHSTAENWADRCCW